jgi:hypothetical protein
VEDLNATATTLMFDDESDLLSDAMENAGLIDMLVGNIEATPTISSSGINALSLTDLDNWSTCAFGDPSKPGSILPQSTCNPIEETTVSSAEKRGNYNLGYQSINYP